MVDELTVSKQNESRSLALCDPETERIAVAGWQLVRELLPANLESDEAFRARISFLKEIVVEVGAERFAEAVKQAIRISQYRSEVSIKRIRECAGMTVAQPQSEAVAAWELVTRIVKYHVKRDAEGNAILTSGIRMVDGNRAEMVELPHIPEGVSRAVRSLGGWSNLLDAYPQWWSQKFTQWKEIYRA